MDKKTKDYLVNKMAELRVKVRKTKTTQKFTKKKDWKDFRVKVNKGKDNGN